MSTQPGPIIWGQRFGGSRGESTATDLQQVVARVLAILSLRRWLFIFALFTGILAALVFSFFLPRQYNLAALFERRDDVVITKLISSNSPYSFETLRRSLAIDLAGYNALSEAMDQIGVTGLRPGQHADELPPEAKAQRQALIGTLSRQIIVSLMEKSTFLDLIEVRYSGDNPDLGMKLVTRLKDNYITRTRQRITDILAKSHDFFSQEAGKRKERVALMETELLQTAMQHPGVDPADPGILDQRLLSENLSMEDLAQRRAEAQTKLKAGEEYLQQLVSGAIGGGTASRPAILTEFVVQNPRRQRLALDIEKVETEIADARSLKQMTDHHPSVVGLRAKLEQLRAEFEREPAVLSREQRAVPTGEGPVANPVDAERRRIEMELKTIRELIVGIDKDNERRKKERARLEDEKGKLFERRQTFLIRQQELQSAKSDLNVWEEHVETISRVLTAETESRGIQFSTMEEARRPSVPVAPTIMGVLMLSAAIGVALAAAAVFLREILDRSFRNPERVRESLGIPVLEMIGEIRTGTPSRWLARNRVLGALACVHFLAVLGVGVLVYTSIEKPALYDRVISRAVAAWRA